MNRLRRIPPQIGAEDLGLYAEYMREYAGYREPVCKRLAAELGGGRVLEVHSGLAMCASDIHAVNPETELITVETSPALIARMRQQAPGAANWHWLIAGECGLPFPDGRFDAAVSANGLHRWRRPVEALRELCRVVRPGGAIVLHDLRHDAQKEILDMVLMSLRSKPAAKRDWLLRYFATSWASAYTREELAELARAAGISRYDLSWDTAMTHTLRIARN